MSRASYKHTDVASPTTKSRHLLCFAALAVILFSALHLNVLLVSAQEPNGWPAQQRIPDFHPETNTPILVADQNRTVHAFSSQWLDDDEDNAVRAIAYNQWTLEGGWTPPVDILLSPLKDDARLTGD